MARVLVEIPRVGLVMETARVMRWLKAVGDTVSPGEPLVEVETEKALVEIEASVGGRLVEIVAQPEQEVAVGAALAWVDDGRPEAAVAVAEIASTPAAAAAPKTSAVAPSPAEKPRASPAARKLAAERGVNLSEIQGTGPGGRIQVVDVERAASARQTSSAARVPAGAASPRRLSPMRKAVARAMTLSNATIPQFTVSRAVDLTQVLAVRASMAPDPQSQGLRISVNDFLLQAVARALLEFPALNAIFVGDPDSPDARVLASSGAHIGLIVALADGMLVPVFHAAERLGLREIARHRTELVERALSGKLRQDEAGGATFTLSNLGARGPDRFTAILSPRESAILAVGRMRDMPVARDGAVTVRPVSELTLTVDHRLADGKLASDFLSRLVQILEGREWR